jgi:hypothetical protein
MIGWEKDLGTSTRLRMSRTTTYCPVSIALRTKGRALCVCSGFSGGEDEGKTEKFLTQEEPLEVILKLNLRENTH